MKKYRYKINNLECANCARNLEEKLNKNPNLSNVNVNFSTSNITYESDNDITLKEIREIVNKIEPDAKIVEKNDTKEEKEYNFNILVIGTLTAIIGMYISLPWHLNFLLIVSSYAILLFRPFLNALRMLIRSKTINENALITISCIGAYFVDKHMEGIMVIFLYLIGKILEEKVLHKTRKTVGDLINIKQDYANKIINNKVVKTDIDDILINDILIVKKGEKIPVDSIVIDGNSKLDTSALTGESELVQVIKNDKVLSGSINTEDILRIRVTNTYKDSTVSRILELLEDATDKKAKTETFVAKASKIYTPIVLLLAVLVTLILPLLSNLNYSESLYRGLTFLVISCPCAIAISVPLSYFAGIGASSKNGILIKGSNYLDNLMHINKIIFDKTGTITTGTFEVKNIEILDDKYSREEIINILFSGESLSNHPIAKSIMKLKNDNIDSKDVKNYKEIEGQGITFEYDNKKIKIGSSKLCNCDFKSDIHLSINNKYVASIFITDGIKEEAQRSIEELKEKNIKTYMFTGDKKNIALEIGKRLRIDEIKYEMLPQDKYHAYEEIKEEKDIVAFVGDGINDAPVLKRADIGISMGGIGSESAIESSDIVIMTDDLQKITKAIDISKYTNKIIKQNLILAISIKIAVLILSITGIATMWSAVFADTGVTLLTIVNTLRIMKKYR